MKRITFFAVAALLFAGAQLHAQAHQAGYDEEGAAQRGRCEAGRRAAAAKPAKAATSQAEASPPAKPRRPPRPHEGRSAAGARPDEEGSRRRQEGYDRQEAVIQAASRFPQLTQYRASSASTGAPQPAHLSRKYRPQFEQNDGVRFRARTAGRARACVRPIRANRGFDLVVAWARAAAAAVRASRRMATIACWV